MNLVIELMHHDPGLKWVMRHLILAPRQPGGPSRARIEVTVVPAPGVAPVVELFRVAQRPTIDQMLGRVLEKHLPHHPVYRDWARAQGHGPVKLVDGVLDNLAEAMHVGLRKLADSPQSALTWNALYHLADEDLAMLWETVRRTMTELFAGQAQPTRAGVANELSRVVTQCARDFVTPVDSQTALQTQAARSFHAGCQLTEPEEWMYAWLGYVVTDDLD